MLPLFYIIISTCVGRIIQAHSPSKESLVTASWESIVFPEQHQFRIAQQQMAKAHIICLTLPHPFPVFFGVTVKNASMFISFFPDSLIICIEILSNAMQAGPVPRWTQFDPTLQPYGFCKAHLRAQGQEPVGAWTNRATCRGCGSLGILQAS